MSESKQNATDRTHVAIIGMGNVGAGVAKLLLDHGDRTARHAGRTLWLRKAVVRDLTKDRGVDLPDGVLTDDVEEVINDPDIQVVAQLIGGTDAARDVMLRLLESGKDIVTANKALLAEHGPELFTRASQLGRTIAFEAAVAGGIPIIANISQCLSANGIESLEGILNGTSNYILSQLDAGGGTYDEIVAKAQQLGYAEADPAMDVDGTDAAQKLAILAHLAFGASVHYADIPRIGIDGIDPIDTDYAKQLGYRIKLLAIARLAEDGLELSVGPTMVRQGTPMAEVQDAFNAISVVGDAVGPVFFHGLGAGQMPTASAVTADLIDTAVGRTKLTFQTLEYFQMDRPPRVKLRDVDNISSRLYLRMHVANDPGTLALIAGALSKHGVSIASVIQHQNESESTGTVPLVILTHTAPTGHADAAIADIESLGAVTGNVVRYRVKT